METWEKFMAVNMLLSIAILLYIFVPWENMDLSFMPPDPEALPPQVLAASKDGQWQIKVHHKADVDLVSLADKPPGSPEQIFVFNNTKTESWDDMDQQAEAVAAVFSPKSQYALVNWQWPIPKYSPIQLELIHLPSKQQEYLPNFDNSNVEVFPIWSHNERYIAVSGGYTVRLWDTKHLKKTIRIDTLNYHGLAVGFADNLKFNNNDSQLIILYAIYDDKTKAYTNQCVKGIFSVTNGKLLRRGIIHC